MSFNENIMLSAVPMEWTPVKRFCPEFFQSYLSLPGDDAYAILEQLEAEGKVESMAGSDSFRFERLYRRKTGWEK